MIKPLSPSSVPGPTPVNLELRKAAQAFEAIMLRQMIGSMRQAKLGDDLFGSSATENFREMSDAKAADDMAATGRFGIAAAIERQFGEAK